MFVFFPIEQFSQCAKERVLITNKAIEVWRNKAKLIFLLLILLLVVVFYHISLFKLKKAINSAEYFNLKWHKDNKKKKQKVLVLVQTKPE